MDNVFAIIVPVYNSAKYLDRCLRSLQSQRVNDWTAICIDDGSDDGSVEILERYSKSDSRIKVYRQKHGGISVTRKHALEFANSDWIVWVDSDDWIEENFLSNFEKKIRSDDLDVIWTGYKIDYAGREESRYQDVDASIKGHARALLEERVWGSLWCRAFRMSFLQKNNISFDNLGLQFQEDLAFVSLCLKCGARIGYVKGCAYHYVQHSGSALHGGCKTKPRALVRLQQTLEFNFQGLGLDDLLLRRRKYTKLMLCKYVLRVGAVEYSRVFGEIRDVDDLPVSFFIKVYFKFVNLIVRFYTKTRAIFCGRTVDAR